MATYTDARRAYSNALKEEYFEKHPELKSEYDEAYESMDSDEWIGYEANFLQKLIYEHTDEIYRKQTDIHASYEEAKSQADSLRTKVKDLSNTISGWNDTGVPSEATENKIRKEYKQHKQQFDDSMAVQGETGMLEQIYESSYAYEMACISGDDAVLDEKYEAMANAYISYSEAYLDEHMLYLKDGHINSQDDMSFISENSELFEKAEMFRKALGKTTAEQTYNENKSISNAEKAEVEETEGEDTPEKQDLQTETVSMSYNSDEVHKSEAAETSEEAELTDEEKKALIEEFDKNADEKRASINSYDSQKSFEQEAATIEAYRSELGLDEQVNDTESKPKNPYDYEKPARTSDMSDADYTALCEQREQEHIDSVNNEIADAVIRGEYGCGMDRIEQLTAAGYDYSQVQSKVNEKMEAYKQTSAPAQASTETTSELKTETEKLEAQLAEYKAKTASLETEVAELKAKVTDVSDEPKEATEESKKKVIKRTTLEAENAADIIERTAKSEKASKKTQETVEAEKQSELSVEKSTSVKSESVSKVSQSALDFGRSMATVSQEDLDFGRSMATVSEDVMNTTTEIATASVDDNGFGKDILTKPVTGDRYNAGINAAESVEDSKSKNKEQEFE